MDIQAGIHVTIVGMALVFAALTILMLAIMVLNRVFKPKEETSSSVAANREGREEENAIVAAIAVALSLASEEEAETRSPRPVSVLSIRRRPGAWRNYARLQSVEQGEPAAKPSRRPNPTRRFSALETKDRVKQRSPGNRVRRQS